LKNAKEEAIVGIGGPILGTVGALVCFAFARHFHSDRLLELSFYGFAINLLNLLPIPPLDGGRITAAVSPWIWPLGFLGLVGMLVAEYVQAGYSLKGVSWVFVLVLFYGAPRLWRTFRHRERTSSYYRISRGASWCIGIAYCLLTAGLVGMFYLVNQIGEFM
jgi:Zn-dependent protease